MNKDETQKMIAAAAARGAQAMAALLEQRGLLQQVGESVIEKTEKALRLYSTWKDMDDPDARRMVAAIDKCLASASNDPYVDTIRLFYFEGLTNAATAKTVCCDYRTAQRNRRELVKQFAARLYPDEYMREML